MQEFSDPVPQTKLILFQVCSRHATASETAQN